MKRNPPEETKFKPGQSGNPAGRPKGVRHLSTVLKEMLEAIAPDAVVDVAEIKQFIKRKKITNADAIAARLMHDAIVEGDIDAIKVIADRTEGKAPASLDVTSGGEKVQTKFVVEVINERTAGNNQSSNE